MPVNTYSDKVPESNEPLDNIGGCAAWMHISHDEANADRVIGRALQ
jgi:hypothetical protein